MAVFEQEMRRRREKPGKVKGSQPGRRRRKERLVGDSVHGSTGCVPVALPGHSVQDPVPLRGRGRCFGHDSLKQHKVRLVIPVCGLLGHVCCGGGNVMAQWLRG